MCLICLGRYENKQLDRSLLGLEGKNGLALRNRRDQYIQARRIEWILSIRVFFREVMLATDCANSRIGESSITIAEVRGKTAINLMVS